MWVVYLYLWTQKKIPDKHILQVGGVSDIGVHTCFRKTLLSWKWLLEHKPHWQILVRSNNGTYFQETYLQQWLPEKYSSTPGGVITNLFAGPMDFGEASFVSGCAMVFSRDVIERVVTYVFTTDKHVPSEETDDVALSHIIRDALAIKPQHMQRVDWVDGPVDVLPKDTWAYRRSQPYGNERCIHKFQALFKQLHHLLLYANQKRTWSAATRSIVCTYAYLLE